MKLRRTKAVAVTRYLSRFVDPRARARPISGISPDLPEVKAIVMNADLGNVRLQRDPKIIADLKSIIVRRKKKTISTRNTPQEGWHGSVNSREGNVH